MYYIRYKYTYKNELDFLVSTIMTLQKYKIVEQKNLYVQVEYLCICI